MHANLRQSGYARLSSNMRYLGNQIQIEITAPVYELKISSIKMLMMLLPFSPKDDKNELKKY